MFLRKASILADSLQRLRRPEPEYLPVNSRARNNAVIGRIPAPAGLRFASRSGRPSAAPARSPASVIASRNVRRIITSLLGRHQVGAKSAPETGIRFVSRRIRAIRIVHNQPVDIGPLVQVPVGVWDCNDRSAGVPGRRTPEL